MKAAIIVAAAFAASASARVLEERQRPTGRPTQNPSGPGSPGGSGPPDVTQCGLDSFVGHTSEALLFCSSLLKSGTATKTATITAGTTITTQKTVYTTLFPPTSTPLPPTTTPKPPTSTPRPPITSTPSPPVTPTSPPVTSTPSASPSAGCGIVGYTKDTAAYYFDSSGTKNTWASCGAACKADAKCKSFAYGEANCMLFDVPAAGNTNYNPMSPYTFYDVSCPTELPVRKRQINISLGLPGGPSSACSCLITSGPAGETRTTSVTVRNTYTSTQTVTRTLSVLPGRVQH